MFVFLIAVATEPLTRDVRTDVDALALVATVFVFHVAVLTVHVAGRFQCTLGVRGTSAHLASIAVTEEAEFTVHHAPKFRTLIGRCSFALAEVTSMGILVKSVLAIRGAHDGATCWIFPTLTDVTPF